MSYDKIQRYQRMSPDLQTEWGTFPNQHMLAHPAQMKYRQPGPPLLATSRSDVIHPRTMGPQGLGYVGDYVPGPMGAETPLLGLSNDTLKTVLILAGIALALYFLLKPDKAKKNPLNVADMNALLDTGWTPPAGWSGAIPTVAPAAASPRRRGRQTRAGKKALSRYAQSRRRDPSTGRFI